MLIIISLNPFKCSAHPMRFSASSDRDWERSRALPNLFLSAPGGEWRNKVGDGKWKLFGALYVELKD